MKTKPIRRSGTQFVGCIPDGATAKFTKAGMILAHPDHEPRFIPLDQLSQDAVEAAFESERFILTLDH